MRLCAGNGRAESELRKGSEQNHLWSPSQGSKDEKNLPTRCVCVCVRGALAARGYGSELRGRKGASEGKKLCDMENMRE